MSSSVEASTFGEVASSVGTAVEREAQQSPASRAGMNPAEFAHFDGPAGSAGAADIAILLDVGLSLTVELGRRRMTVQDVLNLGPGSVVELDKLAGEPVDIFVNGTSIARGEVVVVDEKFGVQITELLSPAKRLAAAI